MRCKMGFNGNYLRNLCSVAFGREPMRPLLYSYYVTHRCALRCVYCSDGKGRPFCEEPVPELGLAEVRKLFDLLRRSGDTLDITGGEPLIREDLEEILTAARERGFRTVVNTKGLGLTKRPRLFELCDVLVVSVDSLKTERLAPLLGGSLSAARGIVGTLDEIPRMAAPSKCRVVLSVVATPETLDDVEDVLERALTNNWGLHFSPQLSGTAVHAGLRDNPRYVRLVERIRQAKRERAGVLGVDEYLLRVRDFTGYRCHPLLMPVIRPDGTMPYPCLERPVVKVDLLAQGSLEKALAEARRQAPDALRCRESCQILCHMALSLLQRHPWQAVGEQRHWRGA
jgi:MoaA/NifB/PqqE/SkfB family radical SAM enzyme